MWQRALTKKIGMDEEQFVKAFIKALQTDAVMDILKQAVTDKLSLEIRELKDLLKEKDHKIKQLQKQVSELENKADGLEQYSRRNSLRIFGIKEKEFENPVDVALKIINDEMGLEMKTDSLDRVHRVGKKPTNGSSRSLLVKFTTYRDRDKVFRNRSRLKNAETGRIYVNEDLTRLRANLVYKARKLKREKKLDDCWTHDGQVLIKDKHGRVKAVNSEADLTAIVA